METAISIAHDWQTLIAGAVALFAAWLTVRTIKRQIKEDKQRYTDAQRSKSWAARVAMPDALSALCDYTERCVTYLMDTAVTVQIPEPPSEAISIIKSSVEYVDPKSAHKMFELIVHYQIHNSRIFDHEKRENEIENSEAIYDTVYLRSLVNRLFEYARNEVDVVPAAELSRADLESALRACVGFEYYGNEGKYSPVMEIIERRYSET